MDKIYRISLYLQTLHLQEGPSHCFIICLKLLRLSADFNSFGKKVPDLRFHGFKALGTKSYLVWLKMI